MPCDQPSLDRVLDSIAKARARFGEMEVEADEVLDGVVGATPDEVLTLDSLVAYAESTYTNALWIAQEKVRVGRGRGEETIALFPPPVSLATQRRSTFDVAATVTLAPPHPPPPSVCVCQGC